MTQPTPDAIRSEIATILGLPPDSLTDSIGVGSIPEWDSLAQLAIITTLEEEFGVQIPEEKMMKVSSLKEIIVLVCGAGERRDVIDRNFEKPAETDGRRMTEVFEKKALSYEDRPIIASLLKRVEKYPSKIALVFEYESVSYRQLASGIRAAAYYLLSDAAEWITGSSFCVDGGSSL